MSLTSPLPRDALCGGARYADLLLIHKGFETLRP